MAKIKTKPVVEQELIDHESTEEYLKGRHDYKELGEMAECPYDKPIAPTDRKRYCWWRGVLDERASRLKVFQAKEEKVVQDTE